ncbi:hypothetical protein D3C84_614940 [compost metagenome]
MSGQDFAVDRLALGAGIGDFVEGFLGRDVHQIERRAKGFGNTDRPTRRFTFHLRRTRQRMRLRPGHALSHQFALQVINQFAVFRVNGRYGTQFQAALETRHQRVIGRHDRVFVGHEMLEAVDAMLADQLGHLFAHLFAPPGDRHMKAIVGRRFFSPAAPLMEGFHQGLLRIGNHKIDDRRGATGQSRRRATEKVFAGHGAHEGQLHVRVWIDAAGHQVLAGAVESFGVRGNIEVFADGLDHAVCAIHIGAITFIMGNNGGATDQQRHSEFLAGNDRLMPVLDVLYKNSPDRLIPVSAVRIKR